MSDTRIRGVFFGMGNAPKPIEIEQRPYGNRGTPTFLGALYDAIGCDMVEKVTISDLVDIVCDEEGLLREKNAHGQPLTYNRSWRVFDDVGARVDIVGNAVAVGFDESTGEWVSLTPQGVMDACDRVLVMATGEQVHVRTWQRSKAWTPTIEQARAWIEEGKSW